MKKQSQKKKKKGVRKKTQGGSRSQIDARVDNISTGTEKDAAKKPPLPIQKKESEKKGEKKPSIFRYADIAIQFLRESKFELKKVKWPTRKELLASTAMVIFLVLIVAFFLGLIDFGLIKIIKSIVG